MLARNAIFERPFCQHFINTARKVSDTVTICLIFNHRVVALLVRFSFISAAYLTLPGSLFLISPISPSQASRSAFASARLIVSPSHAPLWGGSQQITVQTAPQEDHRYRLNPFRRGWHAQTLDTMSCSRLQRFMKHPSVRCSGPEEHRYIPHWLCQKLCCHNLPGTDRQWSNTQ